MGSEDTSPRMDDNARAVPDVEVTWFNGDSRMG